MGTVQPVQVKIYDYYKPDASYFHNRELKQVFCHFSKTCDFSNISCCLELLFAQNNCNVVLESFSTCFWHFKFYPQSNDFAKAIA